MAPLRSRANRNQGDDETSILKGLPIRQWRLTEEKIGPPVEMKPDLGQQIFPELPLPRDFQMLPEISQQLLRKARAGQIYHSPTPPTNGKDDKSKPGGKEAEGGFVSKKWTLLARDKEAEEPTFLAKRRKGLPATFSVGLTTLIPQASYRTTKVKKYDADGKLHVYEVLAPEGQQVEGEIVAEDEAAKAAPVEPVAAAPGTVVEGIGIVNEQGVVVSNDLLQPTPPRRKPPPPRRKPKKGPGRGKKKVLFENGEPGSTTNPDGTPASVLLNVPGVPVERSTDSAVPSSQGDTPMPDAGDDDEGSGSEGEDGEDGDEGREEGELSPSPEHEKADATSEAPEEEGAVPVAEVKEEQPEDDPMDTEEQKGPNETSAADIVMVDTSALPGLTATQKSPSPPPQKTETPSAPAKENSSSPELPLANTGDEEEIPGLPALTPEEEKIETEPKAEPVVETKSIVEAKTAVDAEHAVEPVVDAKPAVDAEPVVEPADKPVNETPVNELAVTEPTVAEPIVSEPAVAEPGIAEPGIAEPIFSEPTVAEPAVAEPSITEPAIAEPATVVEAPSEEVKTEVEADVTKDENGDVDLLGSLEATLDQVGDDADTKEATT